MGERDNRFNPFTTKLNRGAFIAGGVAGLVSVIFVVEGAETVIRLVQQTGQEEATPTPSTPEANLVAEHLGQFRGLYEIGQRFLSDFNFVPSSDPFVSKDGINTLDILQSAAKQTLPSQSLELQDELKILQGKWGDESALDDPQHETRRLGALEKARLIGEQRIQAAHFDLLTKIDYRNSIGEEVLRGELSQLNAAYPGGIAALEDTVKIWDALGGLDDPDKGFIEIPSLLVDRNAGQRIRWHEVTHGIQNHWRELVAVLPKQELATYLQVTLEEVYKHMMNYFNLQSTWQSRKGYNFGNPLVILQGIGQDKPEYTPNMLVDLEGKFRDLIGINVFAEYNTSNGVISAEQAKDDGDVILRWNRLAYFVGRKYLSLLGERKSRSLTKAESDFLNDTDTLKFMQRVAFETNHIFVDPPLQSPVLGKNFGFFGTHVGLNDPHNTLTQSKLRVFKALLAAFSPIRYNDQNPLETGDEIRFKLVA